MGTCCCKSESPHLSRRRKYKLSSYKNLSRSQENKLNSYKNLSRSQEDKLNSYKNPSRSQENKLNSILEELVTKAGVDFSCPEIQDIKSAVSEMIERIKTGINKRGLFSISRTELCGSMAEETAMWKTKCGRYIEFDFLAVLQAACDIKPCCQECFYVEKLLMNLDLLKIYYPGLYRSNLKHEHEREILDDCFTGECLASCGYQELIYQDRRFRWESTFEPSSTRSETQQGCDRCTVDRPTGTLAVIIVEELYVGYSYEFRWTRRAKTLCTPDSNCLPKSEKMDNLKIHIDFLPALEVVQSKQQSADVAASSSGLVLKPTSSEYEHYCFLVAKSCHVCHPRDRGHKSTWRRSGCRAEIDTIVNKMSDKHRKCYQVLKYLTEKIDIPKTLNNYHLKVVMLHHNSSCSDVGEDFAECAFKVLDDLQHAYETNQLKSLHSEGNLLPHSELIIKIIEYETNSRLISALKGAAMCSAVSESDSVSSFVKKVEDFCRKIYAP